MRPPHLMLAFGLLLAAEACRKEAAPPIVPAAPVAPAAAPAPPAPPPAPPMKDADVYFQVIEPHFERVTIYEGPEVFLRELDKTPERARHLLTAHWSVSEISNGGFQQFFAGAAGVMGPEAVAGLQALGLTDNAALLEQAMALLGKNYPREAGPRNRALKALARARKVKPDHSPFAELDERFLQALQARPGGFNATAAGYARQGAVPTTAAP